MLTHKNFKFIFYHFNNYLSQINEPLNFICHSIISEDDLALGALQGKKLAIFYIERLTEVTHQPDIGIDSLGGLGNLEKIDIINDLIQNITICKEVYNNLFNVIADYKADEYVVFLGKRLLHL